MARYVADRSEIAASDAVWAITGQAEIRGVDGGARVFSRHRNSVTRSHLPVEEPPPSDPPRPEKDPSTAPPVEEPPETDPPVKDPPSEEPGALKGVDRMLLLVFLRRYVTNCARRGRFAATNGAAQLFAEVRAFAAWQLQAPPTWGLL